MSWSLADARFIVHRATGLIRRGIVSLHTRGLRGSWERTLAQFRRLSEFFAIVILIVGLALLLSGLIRLIEVKVLGRRGMVTTGD